MRDPGVSDKSQERKVMSQGREVMRLKHRADFVRAAKGKRWHGTALSVQTIAVDAAGEALGPPRVGFTLTRKVGGAVVRNRARRRLKDAWRLSHGLPLRAGYDYVVIGRLDAVRLSFAALQDELARAIAGVHRNKRDGSRHPDRDEPRNVPPKVPQRVRQTP